MVSRYYRQYEPYTLWDLTNFRIPLYTANYT